MSVWCAVLIKVKIKKKFVSFGQKHKLLIKLNTHLGEFIIDYNYGLLFICWVVAYLKDTNAWE